MAKEKETYRLDLEYPYSHGVTLRRNGVSKSAWEYIVYKFGITQAEADDILSIAIDGEDDFGRLQLTVIAER